MNRRVYSRWVVNEVRGLQWEVTPATRVLRTTPNNVTSRSRLLRYIGTSHPPHVPLPPITVVLWTPVRTGEGRDHDDSSVP